MIFRLKQSSSGESITKYFEDNKVPVPFLMMVMAQFCSMIIDRALYLRKNIKGRLFFHILLVIIIHFWLFFILPTVTERLVDSCHHISSATNFFFLQKIHKSCPTEILVRL